MRINQWQIMHHAEINKKLSKASGGENIMCDSVENIKNWYNNCYNMMPDD